VDISGNGMRRVRVRVTGGGIWTGHGGELRKNEFEMKSTF
jgi:hypothetical protein